MKKTSISSWWSYWKQGQKRFSYRSSLYKGLFLSFSFATLFIVLQYVLPFTCQSWETLAPKTPFGFTQRTHISVTASHLTPTQLTQLKATLPGTPVHLVHPQLELIGLAESLNEESKEPRLDLGIFPQYKTQALHADTQISLRIQAPSLELLMEDVIHSKRGKDLKTSMNQSQKRLVKSWSAILPSLITTFKKHIGAEHVERFIVDPVILGSVRNAFMTEIFNRVDLDQFGQFLEDSPALNTLGKLAFEHVDSYDVLGGVFTGAFQEMKTEGKKLGKDLGDSWTSTRILYDALRCGIEGIAMIKLGGVPLLGGPSSLTPCTSRSLKRLKQGAGNVGVSAAKSGAKVVFVQSVKSLKKNQNQAQTSIKILGQDTLKHLNLGPKFQGFWMTIQTNQNLKSHIKTQYGDHVWEQFQNALKEWVRSAQLNQKLDELSGEIKILGQQGLKVLLLDREGKGPNPLLLAVIQEQLQGTIRPVVHVIFGSKNSVQPGFQFTHQDEVR